MQQEYAAFFLLVQFNIWGQRYFIFGEAVAIVRGLHLVSIGMGFNPFLLIVRIVLALAKAILFKHTLNALDSMESRLVPKK